MTFTLKSIPSEKGWLYVSKFGQVKEMFSSEHDQCGRGLKYDTFRSQGDPVVRVPGLAEVLPREPHIRVVSAPLPPHHGTQQRQESGTAQNGTRRESEISHAELSDHLKRELVHKWQEKLGSKYQIIVSLKKIFSKIIRIIFNFLQRSVT